MDWFWHALLVCFVIIPAAVLWIAIIVELIRRRDLSTWQRIGWLIGILIFPIIGSLTYLIITWWHADAATDLGGGAPGRRRSRAPGNDRGFDAPGRAASIRGDQ